MTAAMSKIIVIEDETHIREEVKDWLQFEGYEVRGAANGQDGLEAIGDDPPDLIICDIAMPVMDGHEVLIEVRSNPQLTMIPFIFLTAAADRDSVRKGMNLGADDYLTKPFTHTEVLNAVQSRLGKKAAQEQQVQDYLAALSDALTAEREKRQLKSRLVAMFSHDFRNPLASILSSSSIIRNYEDRLTPERKRQHLDRIDGAVHLLVQMLDDMLMIAEIESDHLEINPVDIDLPHFIENIVDEFRLIDHSAHHLTFYNSLSHPIEADPKLMRQIITNLISNAIKYSPTASEIIIDLSESAGRLSLSVQDQGIGIPEDEIPLLFEPFHRAANTGDIKGTGLGLSIVKDCVERQQGRISVESQLDRGTTFRVDLPLTSPTGSGFGGSLIANTLT